jgi:hypothetical protein
MTKPKPKPMAMTLVLVSWLAGATAQVVLAAEPSGVMALGRGSAARAAVEPAGAAVVVDPVTVASLVEVRGRKLRSPKEAGSGTLTIEGEWLRWQNDEKRKRSFAIQGVVVREATLVCARRAGDNVCLELELRTVTGETYRFRDRNWSAGDSQEIRRVYEVLQRQHPLIKFRERAVSRIR